MPRCRCDVLSVLGRPYTTGIFAIFAHLSETFVFIYMGASVFLCESDKFMTAFVVLVMCFVSRGMSIYPGVKLLNWWAKRSAAAAGGGGGGGGVASPRGSVGGGSGGGGSGGGDGTSWNGPGPSLGGDHLVPHGGVPTNYAHMLWFSGMRGAMAFALALEAAAKRGDDGGVMNTVLTAPGIEATLCSRVADWSVSS